MRKYWSIAILVLLGLSSCSDKICPAFQSYYVLDNNKRDEIFSLVSNDSLPQEFKNYMPEIDDVKKTRYGLIKQAPVLAYIMKENEMMTIEMEKIMPTSADLDTLGSADQQFGEGEIPTDSTEMEIQKLGPGQVGLQNKDAAYNEDQAAYEELYGDQLEAVTKAREDAIVRAEAAQLAAQEAALAEELAEEEEGEEKKKGFFKGLMKKKKKKKKEEAEEPEDDFEPVGDPSGGGEE